MANKLTGHIKLSEIELEKIISKYFKHELKLVGFIGYPKKGKIYQFNLLSRHR